MRGLSAAIFVFAFPSKVGDIRRDAKTLGTESDGQHTFGQEGCTQDRAPDGSEQSAPHRMRGFIRKVEEAIASGDSEAAKQALRMRSRRS
jgi:hypothetical protein